MNYVSLVKNISKAIVVLSFWIVLLLSMLLAEHLDLQSLLFILVKSLLVSALLWVFFAIILDALVKAMVADAREKKVDRVNGGLSFHLASPGQEEQEWNKKDKKEEKRNNKKGN
ncbi:MAG TPA: hypothetical protein VLM37_04580 [Fibrobacteraceae bacterium]|nr:hypothetical protein [Fibrobacteraceae bacterium]